MTLDFVNTAIDNNKPTAFFGPNGLDRTHQFSFGGTIDVPLGLRFGAVGHVYSPLPQSLILPGGGSGGIFIRPTLLAMARVTAAAFILTAIRFPERQLARSDARSRRTT